MRDSVYEEIKRAKKQDRCKRATKILTVRKNTVKIHANKKSPGFAGA